MPSDDEIVLLYLEIAGLFQKASLYQRLNLIKTVEFIYDSEADTDLGDFLNEIVHLLINQLDNPELHASIRDSVYDSQLDYGMLFEVGSTILTDIYLKVC